MRSATAAATLGGDAKQGAFAAAAQVRLIVWCKACQHQVEPDPAEMAARYGADTSVLDWRERTRLFQVRWPRCRFRGDRDGAAIAPPTERSPSPPICPSPCLADRLPLHV